MGVAEIVMPENYIALFNAPEPDKAQEIIGKAETKIEKAIEYIKRGMRFEKPRNNLYDRFMSACVNPIFFKFIVKADDFYATDECVGCGLCAKLCPLNNIEIVDGKPEWGKTARIAWLASTIAQKGNRVRRKEQRQAEISSRLTAKSGFDWLQNRNRNLKQNIAKYQNARFTVRFCTFQVVSLLKSCFSINLISKRVCRYCYKFKRFFTENRYLMRAVAILPFGH